MFLDLLGSSLFQRGLLVAVLVGLSAPVVGTYLVQRRLALLGDGIGHIALTGVALGWLVGVSADLAEKDALAVPGAILASVAGALAIEWVRSRGRTSADVALALLFYGGIAGGVLLIGIAGGTTGNLTGYLFGSIATVSRTDVWLTAALAAIIVCVGLGLRGQLFTVAHDEEYARAAGLNVPLLNILLAVVSALTVSVAMRVVGVLLVSALMIVPVAIAQLVARSFRSAMGLAMAIGVLVTVSGLFITSVKNYSPGATIVVLAVALYAITAALAPLVAARRRRRAGGIIPGGLETSPDRREKISPHQGD